MYTSLGARIWVQPISSKLILKDLLNYLNKKVKLNTMDLPRTMPIFRCHYSSFHRSIWMVGRWRVLDRGDLPLHSATMSNVLVSLYEWFALTYENTLYLRIILRQVFVQRVLAWALPCLLNFQPNSMLLLPGPVVASLETLVGLTQRNVPALFIWKICCIRIIYFSVLGGGLHSKLYYHFWLWICFSLEENFVHL